MPSSSLPFYLFIIIGTISLLYQNGGRDFLIVQKGWFRKVQPLSDFSYTCRRLPNPELEACEDMWLSEKSRQLFLACSDSLSRKEWMPSVGRLNAAGMSQKDRVFAMEIDVKAGDSYKFRELPPVGYSGIKGDRKLSLVGISGMEYHNYIDIYLNNNLPYVDTVTGQLFDNTQTGANSTIERFRVHQSGKADVMTHDKTFLHSQIATPNNMAPTFSGSFYLSNDHGVNKAGLWHQLSPVVKSGDVSYCSTVGHCKRVISGLAFPNGLTLGRKDGLLYVPSTALGDIKVYKSQSDGEVELVERIRVNYALDNMSEDRDGDFWVPGFPDVAATTGAFDDPLGNAKTPTTIFRIRKREYSGYDVTKMLEDGNSEVLPAATAVVHDAKTGRLFISGIYSPFVAVCEKRNAVGD